MEPRDNGQWRALGIFALFGLLAVIWLIRPVGIGVFLGTLVGFTAQPLYRRMTLHSERGRWAALGCVGIVTVALVGMICGFGYLLVARSVALTSALITALSPGGAGRAFLARFGKQLSALHVQPDYVTGKLRDAAADLTTRAAGLAAVVASLTFHVVLMLFFLLLTMHFILRNWDDISRRAEDLLPLHPRHTRALLGQFQSEGRSVLLGTVLTGLAQGGLAGLGYLIAGVPEAAFFGAVTAVASLVPAVGTMLVWVPAGIYLILTGHVGKGILELGWSLLLVVGASDYVIRPALVGGHGKTPALLTFIALFGGIEAFGLIGLILGPIIMTLSLAVLRIYEEESRLRRPPAD